MSIQNLLRTSRSNYGLQFASLYRLTSIRRYSTKVDVIQVNNIQTKRRSLLLTLAITGSAWVQFNHSINASLFAKYVNQKTFYGNKLNVELMKYIPKEIQMDPLNYRVGKCIILAGLPRDVTKSYLEEYLIQKSNKRFELAEIFDDDNEYKMKARVAR
ncbi:unnamed protein product [Rhizophagus irregularis]|nr:unnamed protein product [Rhizophagus irregularis]CAB4441678.1 unnamed protein product [Rhizophagus irregularis]